MGGPASIHRAPLPNVLRQSQHRPHKGVGGAVFIDQGAKLSGFLLTAPVIHHQDGDTANISQHPAKVGEKGAETGALAKTRNDEQQIQNDEL